MAWLRTCLLWALVAVCGAEFVVLPEVDELVKAAGAQLASSDQLAVLSLDDLRRDFELRFPPPIGSLSGLFVAEGGLFTNISSFERFGNMILAAEDSSHKSVNATLVFQDLRARYSSYIFKYTTRSWNGELELERPEGQANLLVKAVAGHPCQYEVTVTLGQLGKVTRRLSGPPPPEEFDDYIDSWVFNDFHLKKKAVVEERIAGAFRQALAGDSALCKRLFGQ